MSVTLTDPARPTDPVAPAQSPSASQTIAPVVIIGTAVLSAAPVIESKLQMIDVVAVAALPLLIPYIRRRPRLSLVAVTLVLWAAVQLLSDSSNGPGPRLSLQLLTAVTMLGLIPLLMWLGSSEYHLMRYVLFGVMVGQAVAWLTAADVSPVLANWKYGLNVPICIGLLAVTDLAWHRGRRWVSFAALGAICVLSVLTDHRHLAGVAVLTGVLLLFPTRRKHPTVTAVATGVILLLGGISGVFIQGAQAGYLGERSWAQVEGYGAHPVGIMVNVRPEPFQELYLFWRRPLLGYGSQPQVNSEDYDASLQFLKNIGVVREDVRERWLNLEVPGVAAHSTAVDSWARAGAGSVPFWVALWVLALWAGVSAIRFKSSPLIVMWTMLILWNTFFEPMTGQYHVELAAYLALALTSIRMPAPKPTTPNEAGAG